MGIFFTKQTDLKKRSIKFKGSYDTKGGKILAIIKAKVCEDGYMFLVYAKTAQQIWVFDTQFLITINSYKTNAR